MSFSVVITANVVSAGKTVVDSCTRSVWDHCRDQSNSMTTLKCFSCSRSASCTTPVHVLDCPSTFPIPRLAVYFAGCHQKPVNGVDSRNSVSSVPPTAHAGSQTNFQYSRSFTVCCAHCCATVLPKSVLESQLSSRSTFGTTIYCSGSWRDLA